MLCVKRSSWHYAVDAFLCDVNLVNDFFHFLFAPDAQAQSRISGCHLPLAYREGTFKSDMYVYKNIQPFLLSFLMDRELRLSSRLIPAHMMLILFNILSKIVLKFLRPARSPKHSFVKHDCVIPASFIYNSCGITSANTRSPI